VIVLAGLAIAAWWIWGRQEPLPDGLILTNGRIEGDHYTVAYKVASRIVQLLAREGDPVKKDQVLLRLDDVQVKARVQQAQAAVNSSKAQLAATRIDLSTLKKTVPLKIASARAAVDHAKAVLSATTVKLEQADRDALRNRTLAEAELGWDQIKSRESQVSAMKAQLEQAKAALDEAQSILDDLTIYAPSTGMITTRIVDIGEVIVAGSPMFDIVDLDRLYLKCYVPEKQIGKLRLGLPARIYTDAFPDNPFSASVRYIASTAEFTPKEVQTPDERVKLVYAVKLYLDANPEHRLTPGLPADAVIRWMEETPWTKPRW
jgi:HlyD family secretion protein